MSSSKEQKKQTKREKKAAKEAAREAARREEARRNRITAAVVAAIVLVGGAIAGVTIWQERQEQAALEEEQLAQQEEIEQQIAEEEEAIEARAVACGADEPPGAGEERDTYDAPGDVLEDGVDYSAVIETSCGELVVDLHADEAPETVNSFVFLAEDGFFDGLEIFRNATSIAALQTGSGTDDAGWDLGYTIPGELELAEEEGYPPGSVAMANPGDPDQAGSQFFFVYDDEFDEAFADNRTYTRFADVVNGLDVLTEIGELGTVGDDQGFPGYEVPEERVYLESVEIVTDG